MITVWFLSLAAFLMLLENVFYVYTAPGLQIIVRFIVEKNSVFNKLKSSAV